TRLREYCCRLFFSSRRRHTRFSRDWSSDVCSSDLIAIKLLVTRAVGIFNLSVKDAVVDKEVKILPSVVKVDGRPKIVRMARGEIERSVDTPRLFFFQYDVDDARHPFRLIACGGVGDDLHPVDHTSLQLPEPIGAVEAQEPGRFAVDEDLDVAASAKVDVALAVNGDRRQVTENVGGGTAGVDRVLAYIEDFLVEGHLDEILFSLHDDFIQVSGSGLDVDFSHVVYRPVRCQRHLVDCPGRIPHKVDHGIEITLRRLK